VFRASVVILAVAVLAAAPATAGLMGPPDPEKVQRKIEKAKSAERQLLVDVIEDEERLSEVLELLSERDRLVAEYAELVTAYREEMKTLNAGYDTTREEFEQAFDEYNGLRAVTQKEIVALIGKMKEATTAEEWKKISKYQVKKLNPRELAYSGEGR
jgi:hypothetical protein